MNSVCRFTCVVASIGFVFAVAPTARAQTPAQMEYERQQREYRQQMEQQRQEQLRQQQIMNENARRQQEESRRLNAPAAPSATPGYQGGTPQAPSRSQAAGRAAPPVVTTATDWFSTCSSKAYGGTDVYVARSTISRSGDMVRMWDMYDFKTQQNADGTRFLSAKHEHEYDCKQPRRRMLSITGYSGNMGKGSVVGSEKTSFPWDPIAAGDFIESCYWKIACGKK